MEKFLSQRSFIILRRTRATKNYFMMKIIWRHPANVVTTPLNNPLNAAVMIEGFQTMVGRTIQIIHLIGRFQMTKRIVELIAFIVTIVVLRYLGL